MKMKERKLDHYSENNNDNGRKKTEEEERERRKEKYKNWGCNTVNTSEAQ